MTDATPDAADARTPDQIAHDDAVPETPTPLDDAAPDAPAEAVFAADTTDRDTASQGVPTDTTPDETVVPVSDTPVMDSVMADQGGPEDYTVPDAPSMAPDASAPVDVAALVQDTNERIRNIESVVTGFVDDAKPLLDKMGSGGISGLLGVILGR